LIHAPQGEAAVTEPIKVLIVDDDKTWQAFLTASLHEKHEVKVVSDGPSCEALALEWQPDAILLDIEMPRKNGYQVCQSLKAELRTRDIPIIFLSAKTSLQEKIAGFELGADDYLIKPCEGELLQAKVQRSARLYREKRALDTRAKDAQILAFEAMTSSADMGRSLRFAERTHAMTSFEKLAEGLFQTMAEFGLDTSVMFITNEGPLFFSHSNYEMSPLEQDMLPPYTRRGVFAILADVPFVISSWYLCWLKTCRWKTPSTMGVSKTFCPGYWGRLTARWVR
jgi:DNA-binding response OmpR family regulator